MKQRANIFEDTLEIDLSTFVPERQDSAAPLPEQIKAVANAANFPSRQASPPATKPAAKTPHRKPRVYRTGRNVQINMKAARETVDDFYAITEEQGWVLGQTLDMAIAALKRELKAKA